MSVQDYQAPPGPVSPTHAVQMDLLARLAVLANRNLPLTELCTLLLRALCRGSGSLCSILRLAPVDDLPGGWYRNSRKGISSHFSQLRPIEEALAAEVMTDGSVQRERFAFDDRRHGIALCFPLPSPERCCGTVTLFFEGFSVGAEAIPAEVEKFWGILGRSVANALDAATTRERLARLREENDARLHELTSLYLVSNTMLSTIQLNKLMHLALTVLTSGPEPIFDRAMLFMINDRAGIMQGMLGVDQETTLHFVTPSVNDRTVSGRLEMADEDIARQRDSEFSREVRASRLPLSRSLNVCSRVVLDKRLIHVSDANSDRRVDREIVHRFGIVSFAAAPLMAKGEVLGVLVVDTSVNGRTISQGDLHFLQLVANQAGMAIENSMLYNRIEDANRSLRETQEQLIQGERLATIGEMSAGIAHELKGPLVSIGGFARRLGRKLPRDSSEAGYVATIVGEVERLEGMLTDILSYSRKTSICYGDCAIAEIVEEALAVVGPVLEEGRVAVTRKITSGQLTLQGDRQQLKQVFINLLLNAREAMPSGGELSVTVAAGRLQGKRAALVRVADTGGGIPANALNTIFSPFFTTKKSGTGLGLSIANRIVTNHLGKILVRNRPGEGAEFTVILPLIA